MVREATRHLFEEGRQEFIVCVIDGVNGTKCSIWGTIPRVGTTKYTRTLYYM